MCKCCTAPMFIAFGVALLAIGGGLIVCGVLVPKAIEKIFHDDVLKRRIVTSNTSQGYDQWQRDYNYTGAVPFDFKVYAFSVLNPNGVLNGEVAQIHQVGPFIYTYYTHYFNETWIKNKNGEVEKVGINQMDAYVFNEQATKEAITGEWDPHKVNITIPNVPLLAVKSQIVSQGTPEWLAALGLDFVSAFVEHQTQSNIADTFVVTNVHDLVWGAESPLLEFLNSLVGPIPTQFGLQTNDTSEEAASARTNHTQDVYWTGATDYKLINQYELWEGKSNLSLWGNDEANKIQGSNGLAFSPFLPIGSDSQEIFVEQIFRHVTLICNETQTIKDINMNVYFLNQTAFNNYITQPEYDLYLPNGAINISSGLAYQKGSPAPVIITQPYFFASDLWYLRNVNFTNVPKLSWEDQQRQHNTLVFVEPYTGITMSALKRLQASVELSPTMLLNTHIASNNTQNSTVIPIAWFELTATISDELADQWKSQVPFAVGAIDYLGMACYITAAALGLLALVLFGMYCQKKQSKTQYVQIQ